MTSCPSVPSEDPFVCGGSLALLAAPLTFCGVAGVPSSDDVVKAAGLPL